MSSVQPVTSTSAALVRPTRARIIVVIFAVTLAIIQYIDRVTISQAAPGIMQDLQLNKEQMGVVFGAFTLAYALFEIPTGYMGDRWGARVVLLRVVLWWSFFTAATGWVWNWSSLVITRFLFGAGEAGCFPNITKTFNRWLPPHERLRAQGVLWMSARWGGAIAPYLTYLVLLYVSWRTAFVLFGLMGVVWAIIFFAWYRDRPEDHRSVNSAELALLPKGEPADEHLNVPWAMIARSRAIWLLCAQYFCCSYAWYFFVTWFPTYLLEVHKFDLKQSALLAGLPLFLGGFGSMFSGWLTPHLQNWIGDKSFTRRIVGVVGFLGAGAFLVLATLLQQPLLAVFAIAAASFFNDISMPGAWTACMEVGNKYVGTIAGTMNMMGNFGGFVSPIVLGIIVQRTGDWNFSFYLTAVLYAIGALCWWLVDPVTPLEEQERRRLAAS